jgi:hypothetical protein
MTNKSTPSSGSLTTTRNNKFRTVFEVGRTSIRTRHGDVKPLATGNRVEHPCRCWRPLRPQRVGGSAAGNGQVPQQVGQSTGQAGARFLRSARPGSLSSSPSRPGGVLPRGWDMVAAWQRAAECEAGDSRAPTLTRRAERKVRRRACAAGARTRPSVALRG